ncbi:MAG: TerB family tellurite resistance protein [Bacteroidia bacterium]
MKVKSGKSKMNKIMAGYHMLMILSQVDGYFAPEEGQVIVKYLHDTFPYRLNLDHEAESLGNLQPDDYHSHFISCMNDFYEDSTEQERIHFLNFAAALVGADHQVTPEENQYLAELFDAWDSGHAE